MRSLAIQEVVLVNFKNYSESQFRLGSKFNLVSGLNGTGKTNLLDAIYYLCVGKSYFTPYDYRVVRHDQTFFRLEGHFSKEPDDHSIIIKVKPGSLKELLVDGTVINRISEHIGFIPVVFSAPRDIDLVFGSSQFRRRYMDHLICQIDPEYLQALMSYNHLLSMRNAALKQAYNDLRRMVQTYDDQMSPLSILIFERRKRIMDSFRSLIQDTYQTLSDQRELVDITYESMLGKYPYEVLADMNWETDKMTSRSNAGIHKDDYKLSIQNTPAKEFGSQGQIKSLIFSLHLTKSRVLGQGSGYKPILILDDIFDKLDENRLHRLMDILSSPEFGQVFISDTSPTRVMGYIAGDQLTHISMADR